MGNPTTTACTVQVPMTLSKRRHRQTLSLQLEQVGHLETSCEKTKLSASLESSPRVTEEKSVVTFLSKQAPRKPSSLSGSEECLKGVELSRAAESDRKSSGFNPFRGHKRAGSGSIIISPCKSLESTPRVKSGSLSFRKESGGSVSFRKEAGGSSSFRKEYGGSVSFRKESGGSGSFRKEVGGSGSFRKEVGGSGSFRKEGGGSGSFRKESGGSGSFRKEGSSSFRKDRSSAIAKIAASLFHSPTKLERSMSMSRLAHKAVIPEEVVSLRQKFQRSSDDAFPAQTTDCKESGSDTSVKDIEESARPLISTASSQQRECVIDTPKNLIKGEEELPELISLEDHPKVLEIAPEKLLLAEAPKLQLLHSDCNNSYVWTKHDFSLPNVTSTENYCSPLALSESNSEELVSPSLDQLLFTTEKVTEEELTEAAVLSSLMSEEYLTSPVFLSSEKLTPIFSPSTMSETGLRRSPCDSDACLKKCMSFEPVARDKTKAGEGGDRKAAKLRKRRRSVSASGIGAMLLKVVRVSDSGPIITRRLPKVGPEVISGAEALRAREFVLQKTAQISMGRASESSSPASARANGACQCDSSEHAVTKSVTYSDKFVDAEVGFGADSTVSELVQQSNDAHEGVDVTGCEDKRATSERLNVEVIPDMELDTTVSGGSCRREGPTTFHEKLERVSSNLQRQTKPAQLLVSSTNAPANTPSANLAENVDERRTGWKPKKKSRSRGRSNSYDFDSLAECPAQTENNFKQGAALSTLDANVAISRERSRSFVSRLQAPSATTVSVDIFRLAPSSISILANPSFSSSHQDRLWEEQAEAYSSGGRGTPGRDDADAPPPPASLFLHSPSPGSAQAGTLSSEDHQVPSASGSLRRSELGKQSKKLGKRGRPEHTPLRSLLADDVKSGSPEGGHFLHQIMSRIRGGSSKSVSPKSPEVTVVKRRSTSWSSCICFSTK